MKRKRFSEEQIITILQEHAAGMKVKDLVRKHGIAEQTFLPLEVKVWWHGCV